MRPLQGTVAFVTTDVDRAAAAMPDPAEFSADVSFSDERDALRYLLAPESDDYIAVMDVLEASVTELTPAEVARKLVGAARPLDADTVDTRLDKLRAWGAVHATTDTSKVLRHSDLLARNWKYSATAAGRQVHRFYRTMLAGNPAAREIPLAGLNRIVRALEALRDNETDDIAETIGIVFVNHDDLDASLVGAEDALAGLADRYDLDDERTAELRTLLVDYATRVAAELEHGAVVATRALDALRPVFDDLAQASVSSSDAQALIERGALQASKGGRTEDWEGLATWFDPGHGRAARFSMRLVRALPGMHANLRRLHTSAGAATNRARALRLAAACGNPTYGAAIALAAMGDHPWRKLHGDTDDGDLTRTPSWETGPRAAVPELLALTGRGGARGRPPAARDDTAARAQVAADRARRVEEHDAAVTEVLAADAKTVLSPLAARVALDTLLTAARRTAKAGARTAIKDGLACTLFHTPGVGLQEAVRSDRWVIWTPDRTVVFHRPDVAVACAEATDDTENIARVITGATA